MNIEDVKLKVKEKFSDRMEALQSEIDSLNEYVLNPTDLYYKASWNDNYYPSRPSGYAEFKTLKDAVIWLSKEDHPMGFSGCYMSIELCVDISNDTIVLEEYDAEDLAHAEYHKRKKHN